MFGFGKKNKGQTPATQPQQLSPEAMAILQQMQSQVGQPQMPNQPMSGQSLPNQPMPGQQMANHQMPGQQVPGQQMQGQQQSMQPESAQQMLMAAMQAPAQQAQMPAQPMPTQPMMPEQNLQNQQISAQPMMQQQMPPMGVGAIDISGMSKSGGKSKRELKKEAAAAKRAEKDKKTKQASEEKTRKRRRKQLSKMRFSRPRYLRESNGNLISSIVLWLFMLMILIGGSVSLVNLYLAPITAENQQTIREIEQLKNTIRNSQPRIQQALAARRERESEVQLLASTLPSAEQTRAQFEQFISRMEAVDIIVENVEIQSIDLGASAITGIQFSANLTTNYLQWLQERNRFMRRQTFGRVPVEVITASDESSDITVQVTMILPAAI